MASVSIKKRSCFAHRVTKRYDLILHNLDSFPAASRSRITSSVWVHEFTVNIDALTLILTGNSVGFWSLHHSVMLEEFEIVKLF